MSEVTTELPIHTAQREPAAEPTGEPPRPSPRLALAPARGQELTGVLGGLARLYMLDVNGTSLLTRCAAVEMKLIAIMLTINFLFDLVVWWLLWNMVFSSGQGAGLLRIVVAAVGALFCSFLFAAIIFVYERQFMTADTYHRLRYVLLPVGLRLIVIAAAAAITTQPFEVMVFSGPIQRRIHEESVRVEAHSRLRALEEAQAKTKAEVGLKDTADYQNLEDFRTKRDEAHNQLNDLRTDAQAARAQMQSAEAAIRSAQASAARARTRGQAIWASRRLAAARSRYDQAQADASAAEARVKVVEADEKNLSSEVDKTTGVVSAKEGLAQQDVKRLQDWVTQVRNAKAGDRVVENRDQAPRWEFEDQDYDFFQRLGVINDLYFGRPARWLDVPPADRKKLADLFSLSEVDERDALTKARLEADAHTFSLSYWAVISLAAVFPLLLLAFKGLLPDDLKMYYSLAEQQRAGNFEALKFRTAGAMSATFQGRDENNPDGRRNGRH